MITNLVNYQKFVIFETDIYENSESRESKIPINIRVLENTEEDINKLTEFWPSDTYGSPFSTPEMIKSSIKERLDAGELCFIAEHNGEIIYMGWFGFQNAHIFTPYEKKRGLGPNEVITHSSYCAEKYRGKNVLSAVHSVKWDFMLKNGYKKLIAYVVPKHQASMKISMRYTEKPVKTVHYLRILGIPLVFLTKASG
jgi:hypothetical protein